MRASAKWLCGNPWVLHEIKLRVLVPKDIPAVSGHGFGAKSSDREGPMVDISGSTGRVTMSVLLNYLDHSST